MKDNKNFLFPWRCNITSWALLAFFGANSSSTAATISRFQNDYCDYLLSGEIRSGDHQRFIREGWFPSATQDPWDTSLGGMRLCLDSPGGSMIEGLRLFQSIWNSAVITIVPPNASCESACAFAFLGGSSKEGTRQSRYQRRFLFAGGRLGFHAPFVPPSGTVSYDSVENSALFDAGVQITALVAGMLNIEDDDVSPINLYLFERIFSTPPSEMFYVSTLADAAALNIDVLGIPSPSVIGNSEIQNICDLAYLRRYQFSHFGSANAMLFDQNFSRSTADRMSEFSDNAPWRISGERIVYSYPDGIDLNFLMRAWEDRPQEVRQRRLLGAVTGYPIGRRGDRSLCMVTLDRGDSTPGLEWGTWRGLAPDGLEFRGFLDDSGTVSVNFFSYWQFREQQEFSEFLFRDESNESVDFNFETWVAMPGVFFNDSSLEF
jgi:hypothetical protein